MSAPTASEQQLVAEWAPLAYAIASEYYLPGGDRDDAKQEALLGLLKGLRDFRRDLGVPLKSFLSLTIRRQVITALKTSTRLKHQSLSKSARAIALDNGDVVDAVDVVADPFADPHRDLVARSELRTVLDRLPRLTDLEQRAIVGIAVGASYREIEGLGRDGKVKQIDNALQRARSKLRRIDRDELEEAA